MPIQTIFPTNKPLRSVGRWGPSFELPTVTFFTCLCTSHHRLARLVSAVRSMGGSTWLNSEDRQTCASRVVMEELGEREKTLT